MPETISGTTKVASKTKAVFVFPSNEDAAAGILFQLSLAPYKAVLLVFGSTENIESKVVPHLELLCRKGIASAAASADAVILNGGANTGIAMLMGEGVASRATKISLIGVAPKAKIKYPNCELRQPEAILLDPEPNHSHFVLVEGEEWGSESPTLFSLADALIQAPIDEARNLEQRALDGATNIEDKQATKEKVRALAILIGGSESTKNQIIEVVRRKLPLIVIEGSGGLADQIIAENKAYIEPDYLPQDADLAEIVSDGEIHFHSIAGLADGMSRLISRELAADKVLQQAWQRFATYDLNAGLQQKWFQQLQLSILGVGVVGTGLAILYEVLKTNGIYTKEGWGWLQPAFHGLLIVIPILLTSLIAASNKFKQGNKWMLLRAAAESIKREIFKYRVKGYYDSGRKTQTLDQNTPRQELLNQEEKLTPEQTLSNKVEEITRRVMQTEVNTTSLKEYTEKVYPPSYKNKGTKTIHEDKKGDDGMTSLSADQYVTVRLEEQIKFFRRKTPMLKSYFFWLTIGILAAGAVGTLLSAFNAPVWIALTTAIAGACTTYLGYMQTEGTLTKYNQAATDLDNVKGWWHALSASEQAMPRNIQLLVDHTEEVLKTELDGWVQQMTDALEMLRKDQAKDKDENRDENIKKRDTENDKNTNEINGAHNREEKENSPQKNGVETMANNGQVSAATENVATDTIKPVSGQNDTKIPTAESGNRNGKEENMSSTFEADSNGREDDENENLTTRKESSDINIDEQQKSEGKI